MLIAGCMLGRASRAVAEECHGLHMSGVVQVEAVVWGAGSIGCHQIAQAAAQTITTVGHLLLHEVETSGYECHAY